MLFCRLLFRLFLQLDSKKRERLLAYVLLGIMGPSLAHLTQPEQLEPSRLLALPVSRSARRGSRLCEARGCTGLPR